MEVFKKLQSFSIDPTFVGMAVEIVAGITVLIADDETFGKKEVYKWGIEMLQVYNYTKLRRGRHPC